MSYTHYWERVVTFEREAFEKAMDDVQMILNRGIDMGIHLAGPTGHGKPELSYETIAFNGSYDCGHKYRDLGKPFASATATGVEEKEPPYDPEALPWLAGPYLETRVCDGHCTAQPFVVDRKYMIRDWERPKPNGRYPCACETHFKPYDLMVTSALIRLRERLGNAIHITSENTEYGYEDAKRLCRELFGWPTNFEIKAAEVDILKLK